MICCCSTSCCCCQGSSGRCFWHMRCWLMLSARLKWHCNGAAARQLPAMRRLRERLHPAPADPRATRSDRRAGGLIGRRSGTGEYRSRSWKLNLTCCRICAAARRAPAAVNSQLERSRPCQIFFTESESTRNPRRCSQRYPPSRGFASGSWTLKETPKTRWRAIDFGFTEMKVIWPPVLGSSSAGGASAGRKSGWGPGDLPAEMEGQADLRPLSARQLEEAG